MFNIIMSGGLLMIPIIACSVIALAITCERLWSLQLARVIPTNLGSKVINDIQSHKMNRDELNQISKKSFFGRIICAAVSAMPSNHFILKQTVEDAGKEVSHDLARNLNLLGIIANISPLLGLLGTVVGMIKIFTAITLQGVGNANALAGGISEALITTAAGLTVAIPAMIAHRSLCRKIEALILQLEIEANIFVKKIINEKITVNQIESV